jgi:hypothetical protein
MFFLITKKEKKGSTICLTELARNLYYIVQSIKLKISQSVWSFSSDNVLSIPLVLMDEYTNIFYKQITK